MILTSVIAVSAEFAVSPILASVLFGGGVFMLLWWIARALATEDAVQKDEWRYDVSRINELRNVDPMFRLFQPVIQWAARINRGAFREQLPEIQREISASGLSRFWLAEEYLGRAELIAVLVSPVYFIFFVRWMAGPGVIVALAGVILTVWFLRHRLAVRARHRLVMIKRRLPFLLDLLTLLMEAGTNFLQALAQAVKEFEGHPVSIEFGRALADMNMGKTRTEAFGALAQRLNDAEIISIIGSIIQGEELGNPLAQIFRTQAEVLRLKRSQRAETLAGEAGVKMLLPGLLIMLATVLIILGPFIVNVFFSGVDYF